MRELTYMPATSTPAKILVADDDPVFQALVANRLTTAGYEVDIAGDGAAALIALQKPYDAAIVDLVMPCVDGFRLIALIRATPRLEDLPIIVLSSRNDPEALREAYRLGANAYETKPVNWALFPLHLSHVMRTCQKISELNAALARKMPKPVKALPALPQSR